MTTLKDMKLCKFSATKSYSGALCEYFKFSLFFASFLTRLFIFGATSPKAQKKNIQKYIFGVKFAALSNAVSRIGLSSEEKPENRKNPSIFEEFITQKHHF